MPGVRSGLELSARGQREVGKGLTTALREGGDHAPQPGPALARKRHRELTQTCVWSRGWEA